MPYYKNMITFAPAKNILKSMAYHKSSEKRIRQTIVKNESNKYYAKTMRNALKEIRSTSCKPEVIHRKTRKQPEINQSTIYSGPLHFDFDGPFLFCFYFLYCMWK
jgi:hypothetical protein